MKKIAFKWIALLLILVMTTSLFGGCNENNTKDGKKTEEVKSDAITTVGDEIKGATHLNMWTFVELHSKFYAKMLEKWNKENPDKPISITFTTYPYSDMHNKLTLAIQSGTGAPDLCDIEIGQFPNYLQGEVQFREMSDVIAPYKESIVPTRLKIYSKDEKYYGIPTHVGATVMYYNTEILEKAGVDYTKIVTWDDWAAAGKKVVDATDAYMGMADTGGSNYVAIMLAEQGKDFTDDKGNPTINTPEAVKAIEMQQKFLKDGIMTVTPGGIPDIEEGYAYIADGKVASFVEPLWYMSRFLNYMPDLTGKIAIGPVPVFEKGQPRSAGIGGTGTVVLKQSKNADLAAEFLTYAKLSVDGNKLIWEDLGFDPTNMELWSDKSVTHDPNNKFIKYFVNNPFDILNEIKDEIKMIKSVKASPSIYEQFNTIILMNCFENNADAKTELQNAQDTLDIDFGE